MKVIDTLRDMYNHKVFKAYKDTWYSVLQIYSDYVDVIQICDNYDEEEAQSPFYIEQTTVTWIDFLQVAELETDQKVLDLVNLEVNKFVVKLAKSELEES